MGTAVADSEISAAVNFRLKVTEVFSVMVLLGLVCSQVSDECGASICAVAVKTDPILSSENLVTIYQTTRCHNPASMTD
jgi:hypothetical protein